MQSLWTAIIQLLENVFILKKGETNDVEQVWEVI